MSGLISSTTPGIMPGDANNVQGAGTDLQAHLKDLCLAKRLESIELCARLDQRHLAEGS